MSGADLPQDKTPDDQFIALIRAVSGVFVRWDTDPQGLPAPQAGMEWAWIEMGVSGSEDVGWDEGRVEPNEGTVPPTQTQTVHGQRQCTLTIMAYSLDPKLKATDLCGRVRMGFNRQDVHDKYMQPNISLRWCEKIIRLSNVTSQNRIILRANMDIALNYAVAANVGNAGPAEYVLGVEGATGTVIQ